MKSLFLYNPRAGRCRPEKLSGIFRARAFWGEIHLQSLDSRSADWSGELGKYDRVAVWGGDGTLHHVIQHLVFKDIELSVFPFGTANDLCGSLGLSSDIRQAADALEQGKCVAYDTIEVNGRHVITGGGFGLGCLAAASANRLRSGPLGFVFRRFRSGIYLATLGWHGLFASPPGVRYRMRLDDLEVGGVTRSILFCNQAVMGKNVLLAPRTSPVDGRFQLIRFLHENSPAILCTLLHLKAGSSRSEKLLDRSEVEKAVIEFEDPLPGYGDGEVFEPGRHWELKCHRGSLRLRVPANFGG